MGYHVGPIIRGEFGEESKIFEEYLEFRDALRQDNPIMALVELSDLVGAIEGWLQKYHPNVSLNELCRMKDATARAFRDGTRSARPPEERPLLGECLNCGLHACGPYWCTACGAP